MVTFRPEFEKGNLRRHIIRRPYGQEVNRMKKLRLSQKQYRGFLSHCKKNGVIPMVTCFTKDSPARMKKLGFEWAKVASCDCGALPFLRIVKNHFRNIVMSTGSANRTEIRRSIKVLGPSLKFLLHCDSIYPTPFQKVNFGKMRRLKKNFKSFGFSDHTNYEKDALS